MRSFIDISTLKKSQFSISNLDALSWEIKVHRMTAWLKFRLLHEEAAELEVCVVSVCF